MSARSCRAGGGDIGEVADHDPVDEVAETARWVLDTLGQRGEGTNVEQPW